jgi:hypothetical protein
MSLNDDMKLERYKLVTGRQKYFTELARGSFSSYMKIFTGLAVAGISLVSAKSKIDLQPQLLILLLKIVIYLITFLGIAAVGQIIFCLIRWKGYRQAESKINPDVPEIKKWWWVFEGLYCAAITASIVLIWMVASSLPNIIK